jgi:hypothetical protein
MSERSPQPRAMYRLDFRRMTVERIDDPKPPRGLRAAVIEPPEDARPAGVTFAALGSPPRPADEDDEE